MNERLPQNFQCRIIYSDIDGTLLNSSHHISPDTREKILELDRKGIPFILVSARMPDAVEVVRKELGNRRPIICYGGGLILDENGQTIYSRRMELDLAVEIRDIVKKQYPGICCNTYGGNLWVVDNDQEPRVIQEEEIVSGKSLAGNIEEIFGKEGGIHKFLFMGEPEDIRKAESFLQKRYEQLSVISSKEDYLEVMDKAVNKAEGVRILCSYYGIPLEEAAAFGDGENDIGMLKAVKYGFAMGNAEEYVKGQAAFVAPTNDEEGILKVIKGL